MLFSFRQVKPFLNGHNSHVMDPTVRNAVQQAEEAVLLSLEQRKELVNCLASDEEEDDDDDRDQTMLSEDESPSKEKNEQKRKNSGDDELTGKKVVKRFKRLLFVEFRPRIMSNCNLAKNKQVSWEKTGCDHLMFTHMYPFL